MTRQQADHGESRRVGFDSPHRLADGGKLIVCGECLVDEHDAPRAVDNKIAAAYAINIQQSR
jgi:hypothetical protein